MYSKLTFCQLDGISYCEIEKNCEQCQKEEDQWLDMWLNDRKNDNIPPCQVIRGRLVPPEKEVDRRQTFK